MAATVCKHTGKIDNLSDPAAVMFTLDLYCEVTHAENPTTI